MPTRERSEGRSRHQSRRRSRAGAAFVLKPWETGEPTPTGPGPDVAKGKGATPGPKPEEEAEELYREAVSYEQDHPEATIESRKDRYNLVVRKFPVSRYAVQAKARIAEKRQVRTGISQPKR